MTVRTVIRPASYWDSVVLLRLAAALRARPGVREAAALLGTPANHERLRSAGLATPLSETASPVDLVVTVAADDPGQAEAALEAVDGLLAEGQGREPGFLTGRERGGLPPRTLRTALARMPEATLVAISVPGVYAAAEARAALRASRHVFLFSDHVSLADELSLKRMAVRRRRLCMGPDCGTAYLGGVGLGFANVVPRGRIGIVAASGTGLQAVACHLAALGEGVSHGLGVGGRDLTAPVGGLMTGLALEILAADPATEAIVVVAKPGDPATLARLAAVLARLDKPSAVCCPGASAPEGARGWVETLDAAAPAIVGALGGVSSTPPPGELLAARLARIRAEPGRRGPGLLGLYTGGTLAHEASALLGPRLGPLGRDLDPGDGPGGAGAPPLHRVVDLGDDRYTAGRPHPMLDPEARAAHVRMAGTDPRVGALLLDLVLGRGAHPDPAGPLAGAAREARAAAARDGRALAVVASVVGTARDPQGLGAQVATLEAAGVHVLASNAAAARLAAACVDPAGAGALQPSAAPTGDLPSPPRRGRGGAPGDPGLAPPHVISLGLTAFAEEVAAQDAPVLHVAWAPPAGGDPALVELLARLEDDEA